MWIQQVTPNRNCDGDYGYDDEEAEQFRVDVSRDRGPEGDGQQQLKLLPALITPLCYIPQPVT